MSSSFSARLCRVVLLGCTTLIAAGNIGTSNASAAPPPATSRSAMTNRLAAELREIANSAGLSRAKKEKRISNTVRMTVVAATAYISEPRDVLRIALDIGTVAGRAAPQYAEIIANAISFAPPVARIEGASSQVRSAAFAAARTPRGQGKLPTKKRIVAPPPIAEPSDEAESGAIADATPPPMPARPAKRRPKPSAPPIAADEPESETAPAESEVTETPVRTRRDPALAPPAISLGDNAALDLTLDIGARRESNIYSEPTNETADTILTATPGIALRTGQNSLAHAGVSYRHSFIRYQNHSSPSVGLSTANADLGFDNGSFSLNGQGTFDQNNRSGNSILANGQKELLRVDTASGSVDSEFHFTAKSSGSIGAGFSRLKYQADDLIGDKTLNIPVKLYHEISPKLDLSTGYTFTQVTPDLDGPKSKDGFTNVGLRGSITPKLSANFSVGYRTRKVDQQPNAPAQASEKTVGFDGSFNYEMTPKSSMALALSRGFGTGPLGESLKNSNYSLRVSAEPSIRWQTSFGLGYRKSDYGPKVFRVGATGTTSDRNDSAWSGSAGATYLFTSWLTATADYTFMNVHSTNQNASYKDSVFGLYLGLRY